MGQNPFQPLLDLIDWIRDPFGVGRLMDRKLPTGSRKPAPPPAPVITKDTGPPPPPFLALCEKAVHFLDDEKHPLINPGLFHAKTGYHLDERVIDAAATAKALDLFRVVAERTANIPPATAGRFAGIPIPQVLTAATEDDLRTFLAYVDQYPKKYIGQEVRIANAFVAWVRAGAE